MNNSIPAPSIKQASKQTINAAEQNQWIVREYYNLPGMMRSSNGFIDICHDYWKYILNPTLISSLVAPKRECSVPLSLRIKCYYLN